MRHESDLAFVESVIGFVAFAVMLIIGALGLAAKPPRRAPARPHRVAREVDNVRPAPSPPRLLQPEQPPMPPAMARTVLFVDVETTGLSYADRLVSFGAVKLRLEPPGEIVWLHLVFNPERRCSKRASEIHGWDNRTLGFQDAFAPYAAPLRAWCDEADLIVAHNAAFDLRFINEAFARHDTPALSAPVVCTMLRYRARGEGSAALDAICARLGLPQRDGHSAVKDAWRCMQTYLWLQGLPWRIAMGDLGPPANFRLPPPKRPRGRPRKTPIAPPPVVEISDGARATLH